MFVQIVHTDNSESVPAYRSPGKPGKPGRPNLYHSNTLFAYFIGNQAIL
jgi:hypothetical protein